MGRKPYKTKNSCEVNQLRKLGFKIPKDIPGEAWVHEKYIDFSVAQTAYDRRRKRISAVIAMTAAKEFYWDGYFYGISGPVERRTKIDL